MAIHIVMEQIIAIIRSGYVRIFIIIHYPIRFNFLCVPAKENKICRRTAYHKYIISTYSCLKKNFQKGIDELKQLKDQILEKELIECIELLLEPEMENGISPMINFVKIMKRSAI